MLRLKVASEEKLTDGGKLFQNESQCKWSLSASSFSVTPGVPLTESQL